MIRDPLAALAILLTGATCAAPPQVAPIELPGKPGIRVMSDCVIERHVQEVEGLRLVTWVMRPPGEGPFPIVVWNHGSRIPLDSWFGSDRTADPTIDFDRPCPSEVTHERWMYVYPEGRGYGGSEGQRLAPLLGDTHAVTEYLRGRAVDANAAARLIQLRPDARRHCAAIGGVSHGGVTALFAAADAPRQYRAVVIQATGVCYRTPCAAPALEAAADAVDTPLLVQHFVSDSRVPIAVSQLIAKRAALHNPAVVLKQYPGTAGEEGHEVNAPGNRSQWIGDYLQTLRAAFAQCEGSSSHVRPAAGDADDPAPRPRQ
jgi:dipeptidyl aminopeptidase/acylaminoacyl peptidase